MTREQRFAQHITELASAFRVVLEVRPGMSPDAAGAGFVFADEHLPLHRQRRAVRIAPVTCEVTYAIALHELGHCLSPLGMVTNTEASDTFRRTHNYATKRDVRLQLLEEQAAWEWARHYALEWTPLMDSVERMAFDTYQMNARQYGVKS